MKKADFGSDAVTMSNALLPNSVCHSIEIRDETLPPWIIPRFCSLMVSRGTNFESWYCIYPQSILILYYFIFLYMNDVDGGFLQLHT